MLLFALLTHMHPGTKKIHPSYATLGKELGCDAKTVMRNVKALSKAALPFLAGAVGGVVAGCTVGGIGPNFFT